MTVRQQQLAIKDFREGTANLLVATSVVEEGFNVAECNVVIRLDAPSTITALIQSRGRLRNKDSRFIAIVKEHDKVKYSELQKQEKMFLSEYEELHATKIKSTEEKKTTKEVLSGSSI